MTLVSAMIPLRFRVYTNLSNPRLKCGDTVLIDYQNVNWYSRCSSRKN